MKKVLDELGRFGAFSLVMLVLLAAFGGLIWLINFIGQWLKNNFGIAPVVAFAVFIALVISYIMFRSTLVKK
jgi:hypothetical protein